MPMLASSRRMASHRENPFMPGSITSSTAASQPPSLPSSASAFSALSASSTS